MPAYLVAASAVTVSLAVGYFIGRARGIEHAGRRWLAVLNRTELGWTLTYRAMHQTHLALEEALVGGLTAAREAVLVLRARLDATAVPKERN